ALSARRDRRTRRAARGLTPRKRRCWRGRHPFSAGRQMPGGDIAKRHRWTDGDTGAVVGATHHVRRIVANGIEAFERNAVAFDHLCMGVAMPAKVPSSPATTRTG